MFIQRFVAIALIATLVCAVPGTSAAATTAHSDEAMPDHSDHSLRVGENPVESASTSSALARGSKHRSTQHVGVKPNPSRVSYLHPPPIPEMPLTASQKAPPSSSTMQIVVTPPKDVKDDSVVEDAAPRDSIPDSHAPAGPAESGDPSDINKLEASIMIDALSGMIQVGALVYDYVQESHGESNSHHHAKERKSEGGKHSHSHASNSHANDPSNTRNSRHTERTRNSVPPHRTGRSRSPNPHVIRHTSPHEDEQDSVVVTRDHHSDSTLRKPHSPRGALSRTASHNSMVRSRDIKDSSSSVSLSRPRDNTKNPRKKTHREGECKEYEAEKENCEEAPRDEDVLDEEDFGMVVEEGEDVENVKSDKKKKKESSSSWLCCFGSRK